MTDATELDEAAVRARLEAASEEVGRLHPDARPDSPNGRQRGVIAASLADVGLLLTALDEARAEVEHVSAARAKPLHFDLDREARARQAAEQERDEFIASWAASELMIATWKEATGAELPGMARAAMLAYDARAEAAESALAAVKALADEWESGGSPLWRGIAAPILRAALATPTTTETTTEGDR